MVDGGISLSLSLPLSALCDHRMTVLGWRRGLLLIAWQQWSVNLHEIPPGFFFDHHLLHIANEPGLNLWVRMCMCVLACMSPLCIEYSPMFCMSISLVICLYGGLSVYLHHGNVWAYIYAFNCSVMYVERNLCWHVFLCDFRCNCTVNVTLGASKHLKAMSTTRHQYSGENLSQVCSCGWLLVHSEEFSLRY